MSQIDYQFADAARPSPASVLKLPLRDYSIGHELLLLRHRNPLLLLSPVGFALLDANEQRQAIVHAAWLCANTWAENTSQPLTGLKLKIWGWRIRKENYPLAIAEFRNYLDAGRICPEVRSMEDAQGRFSGGPFLARLIQYVIKHLGKTEEQAMDYPLGLAHFHYFTHAENEGAIKIPNRDELEFEAWCQEQDAIEEAKLKEKTVKEAK